MISKNYYTGCQKAGTITVQTMDGDDLITEFSSMTNVTKEQAETWLEMANFDLDVALQLFFEHNEKSYDSSLNQTATSNSLKKRNFEDFFDDEVIRAPDEIKRSRLFDDPIPAEEMRAAAPPIISAFQSASTYNDRSSASSVSNGGKSNTLATMFQAPLDIITQGSFESVRVLAEDSDSWMLVNIQSESEFLCHVLNRDLWGDETMKNMILCHFVFWQQMDISHEGEKFSSRYKLNAFPSVCIIDPRTGAIVWRKEGNKATPSVISESLQDFVDRKPCPSKSNVSVNQQARNQQPQPSKVADLNVIVLDVDDNTVCEPTKPTAPVQQESSDETEHYHQLSKPDDSTLSGFSVLQILDKGHMDSSNASCGKKLSLKVKLPSPQQKQVVFQQFTTTSPVSALLYKIADEINGIQRFEVSYGMPVKNLSEIVQKQDIQSLEDIGIDQSMLLHVRIIS